MTVLATNIAEFSRRDYRRVGVPEQAKSAWPIYVDENIGAPSISEHFRRTLIRLIGFSRLHANWDGEGAVEIHQAAIETARDLLVAIYNSGASATAAPLQNGGVLIELERSNGDVILEVLPTGEAEYCFVRDGEVLENHTIAYRSGVVFSLA